MCVCIFAYTHNKGGTSSENNRNESSKWIEIDILKQCCSICLLGFFYAFLGLAFTRLRPPSSLAGLLVPRNASLAVAVIMGKCTFVVFHVEHIVKIHTK